MTNGMLNVVHWKGAGWYAPFQNSDNEVHEYRVADSNVEWVDAKANSLGLGTIGLFLEKPTEDANLIVVDLL